MATVSAKSFFAGGPVRVVQPAIPSPDQPQKPQQNSGGFVQGIKQVGANLAEDFKNRGQNIVNLASSNNPNPLPGMIHGAGQIAGAVGDIFGAGVQAVGEGVNAVLPSSPTIDNSLNSFQHGVSNVVSPVVNAYQGFAQQHPTAAQYVGDAANVASILPIDQLGSMAQKGATEAAAAGKSAIASGVGAAENAASSGIKMAGQAKNLVSDTVTHIPQISETAIKQTPLELFDHYVNVGKGAMQDARNITPMEFAGEFANKALTKVQDSLQEAGAWKGKVLNAIGENKVGDVASQARKDLWNTVAERVGVTTNADGSFKNVAGRISSVANKSDYGLLKEVDSKFAQLGSNPSLRQVDDVIDFIQNKLYNRSQIGQIPVNSKIEGALKQTLGELNGRLKTMGGSLYAKANEKYSSIIDVRDALNKALGAEGNKGASLMKQVFSPNATASKKLFAQVKDLTGIDLTNHAAVAKFVMESLGDSRQAGLLEEVLKGNVSPSKSGIVNYVVDKTLGKLQDPIGKAERIIKSQGTDKPSLMDKAINVKNTFTKAMKDQSGFVDFNAPLRKAGTYDISYVENGQTKTIKNLSKADARSWHTWLTGQGKNPQVNFKAPKK